MREHEDLPISYISQITWSQFDVPNLLYISKCIYATPTLQPARHACFNKYTLLRFCQAATLDAWLRGCDSWWTMGKKSRKAVRSTPNPTVAGQSPAAETCIQPLKSDMGGKAPPLKKVWKDGFLTQAVANL